MLLAFKGFVEVVGVTRSAYLSPLSCFYCSPHPLLNQDSEAPVKIKLLVLTHHVILYRPISSSCCLGIRNSQSLEKSLARVGLLC